MKKKISIGVVGCGNQAQIAHLPFFSRNNRCHLTAICDTDLRKLDYLGSKYNIPKRFQDFQEIVEDEEIDALVISTPNYLHVPMSVTALKYGKHVLCETPMAINLREAREMKKVMKKAKPKFALAMNNRLRPDVQILKNFIQENELGVIYYAKSGWLIGTREWILSPGRLENLSRSGGAFLNLGVHLLDIALYLLSNKVVTSVFASLHKKEVEADVEDTAMCIINFSDGTLLTIEVGWSLLFEKDFLYCNVFGNKGAALLNPLKIQKELHGELYNVTPTITHKNIYETSYQLQNHMFLEYLSGKAHPPLTIDGGLMIAEITEAFYASALREQLVRI
ncbi:MAG: Gfo/Idh/MocA family oxidoreductase [candidate division WOR-3 bacterium]|nr:MAG: Gfo/Idh/MocA family oxidoreductase [candidate division WOR-3 bacterium]